MTILWAQFRAVRNATARGGTASFLITTGISLVWYGMFAFAACAVALLIAEAPDRETVHKLLAPGFVLAFLYWQLIPVLLVTAGVSLQMRKLQVYPIPHNQLFHLEVLLRATTAVEMILLVLGVAAGIVMNPHLPSRYALPLILFTICNLYLSVGVRDVLVRLLAWRRFRELMVLLIVLLAALPQLVLRSGIPESDKQYFSFTSMPVWPWTAASQLATGHWTLLNWLALIAWTAAAYWFGRVQFERGLHFDEEAARATPDTSSTTKPWLDSLLRWPAQLFADPLAALIEKDLRSLLRSPRFRVVFLMGFSFGLLIWFPMAFGRAGSGILKQHFLVITAAYSVLLLSEVAVWNVLGFDRSAAQLYWLAPIKPVFLLIAKNAIAVIAVTMEFVAITVTCLLFRLPLTAAIILQSFLACLVLLLFLLALGNLSSLYYPRPVDPNQSWKRSSATRFQAMLLVLYPLLSLPFVFAYYAQYVWEAAWAFYFVLFLTAITAALAYGLSLERCLSAMSQQKEKILSQLSHGAGPMTS